MAAPKDGQAEGAAGPRDTASEGDGGAPLLPFALGLLLPAGILLYPVARAPKARIGNASRLGPSGCSAAGLLLALVGALLGFALIGIGIRNGTSLGGVMGMPFDFLADVLVLSPDTPLPAVAVPLVAQLPLVVAMAVLAAMTVRTRLTALGGLLVGFAVGALLLPLFGHWSGAAAENVAQANGWLAALGFTDTGGVASTALVGGGAARALLRDLAARIGITPRRLRRFEAAWRAQRHRTPAHDGGLSKGEAAQILGVAAKASEDEVTRAYRTLLSRHHPDKLAHRNPSPEALAEAARYTDSRLSRHRRFRRRTALAAAARRRSVLTRSESPLREQRLYGARRSSAERL